MTYRFYSFVAHHYLSPMQCGIQTAHAVSEMSIQQTEMFVHWANEDKTIIVCGAGNQAGVVQAWESFRIFRDYHGIPIELTLFREDQESMNQMVTACGIIVSENYFNAAKINSPYITGTLADMWVKSDGSACTQHELEFVTFLKSFRLA